MQKIKRIGVYTSGGDCSGLNAALHAITISATKNYGWHVHGIRFNAARSTFEDTRLTAKTVPRSVVNEAGTMLGSMNNSTLPLEESVRHFFQLYHQKKLDALIALCGDGGLRVLRKAKNNAFLNVVVLPKTIDNDVKQTDQAIGFSTACAVATQALETLRSTAQSHQRVIVLEVMGRDTGHVALHSGIAGGADVILIPEIPYQLPHIISALKAKQQQGQAEALVVVAEGTPCPSGDKHIQKGIHRYGGIAHHLSHTLAQAMDLDTRHVALGHLQRGGSPTSQDRMLALSMGVHAVDLVARQKFGRLVVCKKNVITDVFLPHDSHPHPVDPQGEFVTVARKLAIAFGDATAYA